MEKGSIRASSDFINHIGLKVAIDGTGHIFSLTCESLVTYLWQKGRFLARTSLGKKSTKSLIRVGSFAFFGEESIGLGKPRSKWKIIHLMFLSYQTCSWVRDLPGYRVRGSITDTQFSALVSRPNSNGPIAGSSKNLSLGIKLTSQQEFAIWQPAWPTSNIPGSAFEILTGDVRGWMSANENLPFKLMTSLMMEMAVLEMNMCLKTCQKTLQARRKKIESE